MHPDVEEIIVGVERSSRELREALRGLNQEVVRFETPPRIVGAWERFLTAWAAHMTATTRAVESL